MTSARRMDRPILAVWLHGAGLGDIDPNDLCKMQQRLERHTYFLVPKNPTLGPGDEKFQWGCTFSKAQNRKELGFAFGKGVRPP